MMGSSSPFSATTTFGPRMSSTRSGGGGGEHHLDGHYGYVWASLVNGVVNPLCVSVQPRLRRRVDHQIARERLRRLGPAGIVARAPTKMPVPRPSRMITLSGFLCAWIACLSLPIVPPPACVTRACYGSPPQWPATNQRSRNQRERQRRLAPGFASGTFASAAAWGCCSSPVMSRALSTVPGHRHHMIDLAGATVTAAPRRKRGAAGRRGWLLTAASRAPYSRYERALIMSGSGPTVTGQVF
jgi:hypothetical protein